MYSVAAHLPERCITIYSRIDCKIIIHGHLNLHGLGYLYYLQLLMVDKIIKFRGHGNIIRKRSSIRLINRPFLLGLLDRRDFCISFTHGGECARYNKNFIGHFFRPIPNILDSTVSYEI